MTTKICKNCGKTEEGHYYYYKACYTHQEVENFRQKKFEEEEVLSPKEFNEKTDRIVKEARRLFKKPKNHSLSMVSKKDTPSGNHFKRGIQQKEGTFNSQGIQRETFNLSEKMLWLRDYDLNYAKEQIIKSNGEIDDCIIMWKDVKTFIQKLKEQINEWEYYEKRFPHKETKWNRIKARIDKLAGEDLR